MCINSTFSIFKGENFVGGGIKIDGLFKIDLDPSFENNYLSLHPNIDIKRSLMNDTSIWLSHMRLRYISIKRIKKLVNDGILKTLDFTNFGTCVDCIKMLKGVMTFFRSYILISMVFFQLPA